MSNENQRVIPTPKPSDLSTFKIKVGGNAIKPEYKVTSIDIGKVYNKISYARITLSDGDAAVQKFAISDSDDFKPGVEIDIQLGYHSEDETVFKGIITGHGVRVRNEKGSFLVIEARDKAIKLTGSRKSAYFYELKDSEIIEQLASGAGLQTDVEATGVKHKEMVQYHVSDWDFLLARAEACGLLVHTDDGKLIAKKADTSGEIALQLEFGATILEFEATMDAETQVKAIKSKTWNFSDQELVETEGSNPSVTGNGNLDSDVLADVMGIDPLPLLHPGKFEEQELKDWIDARTVRHKLARICGHARFQGLGSMKPGQMIDLKGVGDRFNGKAFVTGVRHQVNGTNWTTDVQFGFSERGFTDQFELADRKASGMLPGVNGLHVGLVTKLGSDPDGEDRIQVKMPLLDNAAEGIWARVSTPDGGNKRGIFFRPEVGDEVLLGFLNDDPRQPVVLGMLNSKKMPAPVTANSDDNHIKGIYTRSEMKFIFDDEKKIITLETPGKQTVVIDDDKGAITLTDKTGNIIEMSDKGITFTSKKDIILDAASGDIKMSATNIKAEASAQLTAKGSAGAEVSAGGNMVVKGAMVQIN
jgi:Rhs element Vgr protein